MVKEASKAPIPSPTWRQAVPEAGDRYTAKYQGYVQSYVPQELEGEYPGGYAETDIANWIEKQVSDGYQVVLGLRKDGASVSAELRDMDKYSPFAGWRLSAFSDSAWDALCYLRFKHDVVFADGWQLRDTSQNTRIRG